jgi:hypothetical protein
MGIMGKLALFAATPGMVAGCCYVIDVTVDSIGIVLERTDARPLGAPGSARAATRAGGTSFFFESRILTCLTNTSRQGSRHRGQTAEQEDTKARKAKLQRPRTAAQGSRSHKQQA